jgi:hypothetical protein
MPRREPSSAGRRWHDPQDPPVATVGQEIEQSIRSLPYVADAFSYITGLLRSAASICSWLGTK